MMKIEYKGGCVQDYYYITLNDVWILCERGDPELILKFDTQQQAQQHIDYLYECLYD